MLSVGGPGQANGHSAPGQVTQLRWRWWRADNRDADYHSSGDPDPGPGQLAGAGEGEEKRCQENFTVIPAIFGKGAYEDLH